MAGDLHRGGVNPTLSHRREQRLQIGGLRGRTHARNDRIGDSGLHRTDQSCAVTRRREAGLEQVGDRGLPVRAGDRQQRQVAGGIAVDRRGHLTEDSPRFIDGHDGGGQRVTDQRGARRIGQHGRGAGAHCLLGKRRSVDVGPRERGIQVTGLDLPRVEGDAAEDQGLGQPRTSHWSAAARQ